MPSRHQVKTSDYTHTPTDDTLTSYPDTAPRSHAENMRMRNAEGRGYMRWTWVKGPVALDGAAGPRSGLTVEEAGQLGVLDDFVVGAVEGGLDHDEVLGVVVREGFAAVLVDAATASGHVHTGPGGDVLVPVSEAGHVLRSEPAVRICVRGGGRG